MSETANFEDGKKASAEFQMLIMRLLKEGLDPKSIGLMACGIGSAMLIKHYGKPVGLEICKGMVESAADGNLDVVQNLKVINENEKN